MIYLALGSNLGDREAQLAAARAALEVEGVRIITQSSLYETPALLPDGAGLDWDKAYYNQVIAVETSLEAPELLALAKRIEAAQGREDRGRWAPREVDIDILDYRGEVLESEALCLPHYAMSQRDFVLVPLQEIAPDWQYPSTQQPIAALIAALPKQEVKRL